MDGAGERRLNRKAVNMPISSIFVHAGAGYHSTTNEHIHLGACSDAAKMAIKILKTGGSAVDAVEAAIKVLEDREITNAGYGSNLTIEGAVECDATVVDHLGRSGACGAVAKVKNPINLARLILELSSRPLTLRRVPPNLLVAEGAADFAYEHGISQVFHDTLISKNARDRYTRWREDLRKAGGFRLTPDPNDNLSNSEDARHDDDQVRKHNKQQRDHVNAYMNGTWNEGQPDSPATRSPAINASDLSPSYFPGSPIRSYIPKSPSPQSLKEASGTKRPYSASPSPSLPEPKRPRTHSTRSADSVGRTHSLLANGTTSQEVQKSAPNVALSTLARVMHLRSDSTDGPIDIEGPGLSAILEDDPSQRTTHYEDLITDTVGAIAIDMHGNIAAGSSSGGIGMKHRGRVGPAALVGVGTAVIPVDPEDPEKIAVAAVTSGTGEHMATTMAAQKCAERLYYNQQRGQGATNVPASEEEALESFITVDFMDHPGVKNSTSTGAIGIMAVKKTSTGFYLHFAHNTDSFALASMHSNEKDAKCVMSRVGEHAQVVQGGRKIRVD